MNARPLSLAPALRLVPKEHVMDIPKKPDSDRQRMIEDALIGVHSLLRDPLKGPATKEDVAKVHSGLAATFEAHDQKDETRHHDAMGAIRGMDARVTKLEEARLTVPRPNISTMPRSMSPPGGLRLDPEQTLHGKTKLPDAQFQALLGRLDELEGDVHAISEERDKAREAEEQERLRKEGAERFAASVKAKADEDAIIARKAASALAAQAAKTRRNLKFIVAIAVAVSGAIGTLASELRHDVGHEHAPTHTPEGK